MKRKIQERKTYVTLDTAFNEFIQQKEANGLASSTIRNYNLSYHIFYTYNEFDKETPVTEINSNIINKWINHMRKEEIAPSSMNHYLRDIRAFANFCVKREYLEANIEIPQVKQQEELPKFYSDEDIEKLLTKPTNNDTFAEWRTWGIVNFVLATGARAATVRNVKLDDINFNDNVVNLSTHTKNRDALTVPLSTSLANALREYTRKWGITDYLFPNVGNEQLTDSALRSAYVRYCQARGVEQTNIHGLRHSFTGLSDSGYLLQVISALRCSFSQATLSFLMQQSRMNCWVMSLAFVPSLAISSTFSAFFSFAIITNSFA